MMRSLDVVCPVFREEEMIELFHRQLTAALQPLEQRYRIRIVYVLDPSPDKTEPLLQAISAHDPRVEVIVMSRRFGHQAALIAGIDSSRGDAVIMLDSDLQHPPELIAGIVERWENGADIVQMVRQDGRETGLVKRLTSRWFYFVRNRLYVGRKYGASWGGLLPRLGIVTENCFLVIVWVARSGPDVPRRSQMSPVRVRSMA